MIRDVISGSNTWLVFINDRFFLVYPCFSQSLKHVSYILYYFIYKLTKTSNKVYNQVQSKALIMITLHLNEGKGVICRLSCRWPHNCVLRCTDLRLLQSTQLFEYYLSYVSFGTRSASLRWFVLRWTQAYDAFGKRSQDCLMKSLHARNISIPDSLLNKMCMCANFFSFLNEQTHKSRSLEHWWV